MVNLKIHLKEVSIHYFTLSSASWGFPFLCTSFTINLFRILRFVFFFLFPFSFCFLPRRFFSVLTFPLLIHFSSIDFLYRSLLIHWNIKHSHFPAITHHYKICLSFILLLSMNFHFRSPALYFLPFHPFSLTLSLFLLFDLHIFPPSLKSYKYSPPIFVYLLHVNVLLVNQNFCLLSGKGSISACRSIMIQRFPIIQVFLVNQD